MLIYYLIWSFICLAAFFFKRTAANKLTFILFIIFLIVFTGLRFQIGGDWGNYLQIYDYFKGLSFNESLFITDPGYSFFNYLSQIIGFSDTIFVNFLCSIFFYISFIFFYKKIENYWISLLVSFPYLILVVSMGYTRQSVAISFFLIAMLYAIEKKLVNFLVFSLLAFIFHKSAIIILMFAPLFFLPRTFNSNFVFLSYTFFSFLVMSSAVYISSVSGENIYTDQSGEVSSAGAIFRIIVHFLPLIFYIFYRSEIKRILLEKIRLFDYLSLLILYTLALAIPFSTLADRFNLYLIVYDIFVFSYLFTILNVFNRQVMLGFIIFFNTIMLIIWLNFGAWSHAWLPYQNYLFNYIIESF
ncbi:EpsG family protein [Acinetobacter sp. KS-LM10]|uniref:EpsG family protein n=1 Tax=Acinetobacter sp. KS-LM10 TaxID=3120518 RepID=UPI0030D39BEB